VRQCYSQPQDVQKPATIRENTLPRLQTHQNTRNCQNMMQARIIRDHIAKETIGTSSKDQKKRWDYFRSDLCLNIRGRPRQWLLSRVRYDEAITNFNYSLCLVLLSKKTIASASLADVEFAAQSTTVELRSGAICGPRV
jgi:hypothetical protein